MSVNANSDMDSTNSTVKGYFRLGSRTTDVIEFDNNTSMLDLYGYIYQWFNDIAPRNFHIKYYSFEQKQIFILDGDLLESVNNPFRSDSTNNNQEIIDKIDCLQLLIIPDPPSVDEINPPSNILSLSNEIDAALFNITLPIECHNALLPPSLVLNPSYEVVSDNNISFNNAGEEDTDDGDAMGGNSVAENAQLNSQNSIASLNEYQVAAETTDENVTESDRILFSHDVHPDQRHRYLSDKYSVEDGLPKNGDIACLQGTKTDEELQDGAQVLPKLLIPRLLRRLEEFTLLCYAVYEEEEVDGTRVWYKNHRKGFLLPAQLEPKAKLLNPFPLVLNSIEWTKNGEYILKILLLTDLDKSVKPKEEIYRLDKLTIHQIHDAENIKVSKRTHLKPTRIICVPVINNEPNWPLFALSNFIHPLTKKSPSVSLSTTTVLVPTPIVHLNAIDIADCHQSQQQNLLSANLNTIAAVQIISPVPKRRKI